MINREVSLLVIVSLLPLGQPPERKKEKCLIFQTYRFYCTINSTNNKVNLHNFTLVILGNNCLFLIPVK